LVSITASCHVISTGGAVIIGGISGVFVFFGSKYLAGKKIDDTIGVESLGYAN